MSRKFRGPLATASARRRAAQNLAKAFGYPSVVAMEQDDHGNGIHEGYDKVVAARTALEDAASYLDGRIAAKARDFAHLLLPFERELARLAKHAVRPWVVRVGGRQIGLVGAGHSRAVAWRTALELRAARRNAGRKLKGRTTIRRS